MEKQTRQHIWSRDFILCFFAYLAFSFVLNILIPTLPLYLSRLGRNEVDIGILIGSFTVSSVVLRPFVGRALLKVPEKNFMIAGALLYVFTSIGYLFFLHFWPFLVVRLVQGIGYAFFHTASFTLIARISAEAHRGQSFSFFYLAYNISSVLAPSLGIFLITDFGFSPLFLVCTGVSLCSVWVTSRVAKRRVIPEKDSSAPPVPSAEDGFLLSRKAVPPSIICFFSFFIWGALAAFFPLYAINQGVDNPGLFFTAIAAMIILCRGFGGKILDLYSRERIILPAITTYIISMAILAYSKTLPMFILVALIYGMGPAFLSPALVAYTLDRAGSSPGPAMGTYQSVSDLGMSLGPVIMGIVLHATNYQVMFLCLAFSGLISLNYFYFFVRQRG
jgi:MFS family permease